MLVGVKGVPRVLYGMILRKHLTPKNLLKLLNRLETRNTKSGDWELEGVLLCCTIKGRVSYSAVKEFLCLIL